MIHVLVSHEQWTFAAELAAEASDREHRWITTHGYLVRVIREHLDREAKRKQWEAAHKK